MNGVSKDTELPERTNAVTGQYAAAGVKLAKQLQLPYVDLWTEVAKHANWETAFLEDGLHLTPAGNKAVFDLIAAKIHDAIPALRCDGGAVQKLTFVVETKMAPFWHTMCV